MTRSGVIQASTDEAQQCRSCITLALGHRAEGEVLLAGGPIRTAASEGRPLDVVDLGGGVSVLRFAVINSARVEVEFG